MEEFASYLFYFVLGIIVFVFFSNYRRNVELVTSSVDGEKYLVRKMEDNKEAANHLAFIRKSLNDLVEIIELKYKNNPASLYPEYMKANNNMGVSSETEFNATIKRLLYNYNPKSCVFSENTPNSRYTAYSVNKGQELVFCLRLKKEGDRLVPKNTILFVALHEITHIMTKSIGHEPEFWNNFAFMLKIAIDNNIYTSVDFNNNPKQYCSIQITDTPYKPT
jgi:predicted metal-dependent hydrolase